MLPIALQLYSVREDAEKNLAGVLRQVKEMGYDGIELAGLYGHTPAEVKQLAGEAGLEPVSAHVLYSDMMDDPKGVLAGYSELGCRYVAIPYMTEEYRMGAEKAAEALAGMRMLGEVAKGLGIQLLYHNHDFEFAMVDGEFALDALYKAVPAGLLQTEIDTCWVKAVGQNPADYVRKYAGRAPVVHLKDFYMEGGGAEGAYGLIGRKDDAPSRSTAFQFRHLGAGMQDIPALLEASRDAKAQWLVVEQDQPTEGITPMECARLSIAYLKSL